MQQVWHVAIQGRRTQMGTPTNAVQRLAQTGFEPPPHFLLTRSSHWAARRADSFCIALRFLTLSASAKSRGNVLKLPNEK